MQRPGDITPHLDLLALDALRAGEGTEADRAHVESCERCRVELAALRALESSVRADEAAVLAELGPVPEEVDAAVLTAARRSLSPRRKVAVLGRRGRLAAAAAILLGSVAALWLASELGDRTDPEVRVADRMDVNGDGEVTIVDAYTLAVRIRNGDGTVTEDDVAYVARQSVSLARWRGR